jgi:ribulose-phosphate 3-epimerase
LSVKIAPSVLAADFGRLADEVRAAESGGADWIHVDIMDGHFVPNISFGPAVTAAVKRATSLPLDVHLMIERPERYLEAFRDAGASVLTVHQETCPHLHRTVESIRELGVRPGVTINPATPIETLTEVLPLVDLVLVMSVNPGFGGQSFIPASLDKIRRMRDVIHRTGRAIELEVDGGVVPGNARDLADAGVTVMVAGSSVFRHPGGAAAGIAALRAALTDES